MATNDGAGMTRRDLFRVGVGAATAAAATGAAQPTYAQEEFDYGGWFEDANNYDGTVDMTGEDEVTVEVGAGENALAFGPPAVHVDVGTTVVFEWTGEGGTHNVVERETGERYGSDLADEAGTRYPITFESDGISTYVCSPHSSVGMKGAVVVGNGEGVPDVSEGEMTVGGGGGDGGGSGDGGDGSDGSGSGDGGDGSDGGDGEVPPAMKGDNSVFALFGLSAVIAFLSPFAVVVLMRQNDASEA
ncbi:halocyanin domain-containing protein [Natronomonas sp. LN261]|jgi:halocyanin-like protein|uniref:halocyanin domain-containing protein n=1 Tax=Natronomonas sp. LN261 TaxID=2750669 RepID=UPI002102A708|nr:halocyanin domain-containing protein [Natronomonas sp. LN261]